MNWNKGIDNSLTTSYQWDDMEQLTYEYEKGWQVVKVGYLRRWDGKNGAQRGERR